MGGAMSSSTASSNVVDAQRSDIFATPREQAAFEKLVGRTHVPREDAAYQVVFSVPKPLTQLTQAQIEFLNREYGATIAQNNLQSGNFRVLLRFVLHALPFCCRIDRMTPDEFAAHAPASPPRRTLDGPNSSSASSPRPKQKTVECYVAEAVNALFLVRNFAMQFVAKQDECPLLTHFNRDAPTDDWTASVSPRRREAANETSDDLALRFLDTLVTVLIDFAPTARTYDLHVEVVSLLLVLLSPVAYPRDHSRNVDDQPAPLASKDTRTAQLAVEHATTMSLIKTSEATDRADDAAHFSYLTLEGLGSIATSIFRLPLSVLHYFVPANAQASPLAERSAFVLLVLLQSYRDSDDNASVTNPFRDALGSLTDADTRDSDSSISTGANSGTNDRAHDDSSTSPHHLELSFSQLFAAVGRTAAFETSHLLLYTLLYANPRVLAAAVSPSTPSDLTRLVLPLLETLYHARSIDPSRIYMLVVVLLTLTQDAAFVRDAHVKHVVSSVPWFADRVVTDVSLGSLFVVLVTRLIVRNITHFQDSFLHLNAFAALSNLARSAENLHVFAAQGLVTLIDMLAKKEMQIGIKIATLATERSDENDDDTEATERETLESKRAAYVEFIRLLLGVVSSCLKTKLLPRNPQLIYSLLYRAETFTALQQHAEFAHHVDYAPVWSALARFQALVDAKTTPDDVLDVDTVLQIIRTECVSLLAATATQTLPTAAATTASQLDDDDASYRYEEEACPEQFFVPYIWRLVFEHTPDFCWRVDKITLFPLPTA